MKLFDTLTEENFELFAAKHYDNKQCIDVQEFKEDLNRFKYIKRLLTRYELSEDLQERLILNHLIIIYNVFGIEAANRMIWFKIKKSQWHIIKPFLVLLNYLPESEKLNVAMDPYVVERLRKL
jgi:hypothetical protein